MAHPGSELSYNPSQAQQVQDITVGLVAGAILFVIVRRAG